MAGKIRVQVGLLVPERGWEMGSWRTEQATGSGQQNRVTERVDTKHPVPIHSHWGGIRLRTLQDWLALA